MGGHILQEAIPWRNLLCWLVSSPPPCSRVLYDTCHFSYLKICVHLYTEKVLDAHSGLATLVVPAVQWTTKGSAHVSCKELNKCNLCGEVLLLLRTCFCFFLWHRNITFHCFVKNTSFKLRDSAFCLDRTFIRTIRTAGWPGSAGLVTEHRWYVWVRGVFFPKLQSTAHRQTLHPNVPLPINTMPFCSGIWDQKGYVAARASAETEACQRLNGQE